LAQVPYETAYPRVEILPSSRNWWAKLKGTAAECIHTREGCEWIAALLPDTLFLDTILGELEEFDGRIVSFEPNPEIFTQYFFVATPDFEAAGVAPETASAIEQRLAQAGEACAECSRPATWLWMSREQVASLDETDKIRGERGEWFCSLHGARKLADAFERIAEANVFYMNLPYGEAGAYLWI
jgi:hypothetical protein